MIIGIGGEPATGKSTLMRALIEALAPGSDLPVKEEAHGLLRYTRHTLVTAYQRRFSFVEQLLPVAVLGVGYQEPAPFETFPGTDRLSMAVQRDAAEWLERFDRPPVVLFEGDRLFNASFLEVCRAKRLMPEPCWFYLLTSSQLDARHVQRGDKQSETFRKGRATKARNLAQLPYVITVAHETPADTARLVDEILSLIRCVHAP